MSWNVCIEIPELPDPLELVLPGGMAIKSRNLDELIQPALAPLGPAFAIIDSVVALSTLLTEVGKALVTMNFAAAGEALVKAGAVPKKLESLAPAYAVPALLAGCVDTVLRALTNVRSQLVQLQAQVSALVHVEAVAHRLGDAKLMQVFECAQHNIGQEAANVGKSMASVGQILGLIELLSGLAGHSIKVPDLGNIGGKELHEAIAPLDALISAVSGLRNVLPVPK